MAKRNAKKCIKKKFRTRNGAWSELVTTMNKSSSGDNKRKECRTYYCGQCKAFHLTSKGLNYVGSV
jgi:hypothetical protein